MALLSVENLRVKFHTDRGDVYAVNGVDLELEKGETLGIVGESGSGKSVSSLAIMGLLPSPPAQVSASRIEFSGQDLQTLDERSRRQLRGNRMAMIFQDPMTSLNPYLRISRQLTEVLQLHRKMKRKQALKQVIAMMERVGIPDAPKRVHSYPHEFSGGMRQRVMIAMSLLCEPELLIADEPTTALDVTIQAQILDLLKELQRDLGMAIILITHDLGVVAGMANRVAVLYAGRVAERASAVDLFERPLHPYTEGLLKSVPRLDDQAGSTLYTIPGLPPLLTHTPVGCAFAARCEHALDDCAIQDPPNRSQTDNRQSYCWLPPDSGEASR
jgi:oligopeptide transport system ATP-binding protein